MANTYFAGATDKDRQASPLDERRRKWHDLGVAELGLTRALGERHTLSAGVQVTGEWFQQDLTRVEADGEQVRTTEVAEVPRRQLLSEEVYLQDEIALGRVVLAPGARYVHHHAFGQALAPRLAVAGAPHPRLRLRGQVGRGFRAPSAQELAFNFDHSFYGYKVVGNPDLLPETSVGVLGGAELTLPGGLALHGTTYYNRLTNLIVTEIDPEQSRPELSVSTYKNIGRAFTAGAEAGLAWRPWRRVTLDGGYAYLRAIDQSTGLAVPGRPPHTVQGALSLRLPRVETQVDLRVRATSRTVPPGRVDPADLAGLGDGRPAPGPAAGPVVGGTAGRGTPRNSTPASRTCSAPGAIPLTRPICGPSPAGWSTPACGYGTDRDTDKKERNRCRAFAFRELL